MRKVEIDRALKAKSLQILEKRKEIEKLKFEIRDMGRAYFRKRDRIMRKRRLKQKKEAEKK